MRFKKMESLKESEKRGLVFTFMNMGVVLCLPLTKLVPSSFSLEDPNKNKDVSYAVNTLSTTRQIDRELLRSRFF